MERIMKEAATLIALALFIAMIATWAQLIPILAGF